MKTKLVVPVLFTIALLLQTGCTLLSESSNSSGPARVQVEKKPSENYYYLEARHHIKNNDLAKAAASLEKGLRQAPNSFLITQNLAFIYLKAGHTDRAMALVEALVANNPDDVDALLLYIQLKQDSMEQKKLVTLLNKVLTLAPDNKETHLRLGKLYMSMEDHAKSKAHFSKMVKQFPDYYVAWYYLGEIHMLNKEYKQAETAFLKTIELEPELLEPRFRLVKVYEALKRKDRFTKTEEAYQQILKLEPDNPKALTGRALNKHKRGRKTEAKKDLLEIGRDLKDDQNLLSSLFDYYLLKENKLDAVIVFSSMQKADPDNSNLNLFAAMSYEGAKLFKKAIPLYLNIKPGHSHYQKAILNASVLYWETSQKQQALTFLTEKQKELPEDIDITVYLASFYGQEKKYNKAIKVLETGLKHSPDNPTLLFRMGVTQDQAKHREMALEAMKKVIEIDPDHASALNYLGYTYADMGIHLEYALELIQKAHNIEPDNGHITDSMGWIHFKLGNLDEALKYLKTSVEQTNNEAVVVEHLGDVHAKRQEYQQAIDAYKKAIKNAGPDWDDRKLTEIEEKIKTLQKKVDGKK